MRTIESTNELKRLMGAYFQGIKKPVAWCTSVGPAELLRSFGFEVYFPENHGALLGATRTAGDYIPAAVKEGYAGDICSYLTSDIGAHLSGETPLKKHYGLKEVPRPDLIVYNTNQCREVQDWFGFFAKEYDVPVFGITPPRHVDEVTSAHVADVVSQFKDMLPLCEKISGNRFDIDRCLPPRLEQRQPGAFAPYGFGGHTCAGAGFAEVEIMATAATLFHELELALADPAYQLHRTYSPSPAPDKNCRIRVVRRRV